MKVFVFHANIHQRVTSAEEDFNDQEVRMTCSVDTSQPLSSPNGLMSKVAMVAGIEITHGPNDIDIHASLVCL